MKFADLIAKLAKKAGVDVTSDDFKKITIPDIDVPDDIASALDQKLMNEAAAASNSTIRNKIKAETLNGFDALVEQIIETEQLQGIDGIKGAGTTFEKVKKLFEHQKEHFGQKLKDAVKPGKDGVDKTAYETQITDLNKQLAAQKKALADKETEFNNTRESDTLNFEIQKILLGKDYALPKEMDADLKIQMANTAFQKQLTTKGLKIVRNENKQLVIVKNDGTPAFNEANESIELNSFLDGALAQNKLLKVNDQADDTAGDGKNNVHIPAGGNNGQQKGTQSFKDGLNSLEAMIADQSKGTS